MSFVHDSPNHYYAIEPMVAQVDRELEDLSDAQIARMADRADRDLLKTKKWENLRPDERREWRSLEAHAKRQQAAALKAEQAADARRVEERERARVDAEIADYQAHMRRGFPGSDAQFAAAWPEILRSWQVSQAQQQRDAVYELARARVGRAF